MNDSKLGSACGLGVVGAVILLLSVLFSFISFLVELISWVISVLLILVALKYIAEASGEKGIFNNFLIAFVFGILGFLLILSPILAPTSPVGIAYYSSPLYFLGARWIVALIQVYFAYESLVAINKSFRVQMFVTAAEFNIFAAVILIGSIYLAVDVIYTIVLVISDLLLAYAFGLLAQQIGVPSASNAEGRFSSRDNQNNSSSPVSPVPAVSSRNPNYGDKHSNRDFSSSGSDSILDAKRSKGASKKKFCVRCGIELPLSATFCSRCGFKQ